MKTKKILTTITAVAMALTLGVGSLAGCKKDGGHQHAYNWTIDREATCVEQGYRTGVCVCGDVKTEYIPINPDAHVFEDDWAVTAYPTESTEGRAERICQLDSTHKVVANLPAITAQGTGYASSEVTVKPTIIAAGNRHFVYSHAAGDVEFDIELPQRTKIENIEDVIIYASSLHNNIRTSGGNYVYGDPDGTDVQSHDFSNYYGNNYTRVHDGGNERDFWYSIDENGNPFGISAVTETVVLNPLGPDDVDEDGNPKDPNYTQQLGTISKDPLIDESAEEADLLGYGYASGGGMRATYGAEDTLLAYYESSQDEGAIKYNSDFEKRSDESYSGWFEYSRKEETHFCRYRIDFTTFPTGEIKTLSVATKIIRTFMLANTFNGTNANETELIFGEDGDIIFSEIYPISESTGEEEYETATDAEGKTYIVTDGVKTKPDGSPILDKAGNSIARPVPLGWNEADGRQYYYEADSTHPTDHEYIAMRSINFTQTLKVAGEKVEDNPYPSESRFIRSFDISYGGTVIGENDTVEITADESARFDISNIQPSDTAKLEYDPIRVYLKLETGGEVELNYTGNIDTDDAGFNENAYHIIGYFSGEERRVIIRAQKMGDLSLILRTRGGKCERELKIKVNPGNPTGFNSQAYIYSDAGGVETYTWTNYDYTYEDANSVITLYAGQSLYVRALPLASEQNYVDGTFVTSVSKTFSPYVKTEDNLTLADGTKVSKITAVAPAPAGLEPIEFNLNSVRMGTDGKPVAFKTMGIKIVEAPSVADLLTGTHTGRFSRIRLLESDNSGNLVSADVTATFVAETANSGKINIRVTDGTTTRTCTYSYEYDPETRAFVCRWESGIESKDTFAFDIKINDAFKISITHPTYEGRSETIVLSKQGS